MGVLIALLKSDQDWDALYASITRRKGIPAVIATLDYLKDLGATSALIEEEYLDRDFTAEFSAFYSKVFKRYSKDCLRIHFFLEDKRRMLQNSCSVEFKKFIMQHDLPRFVWVTEFGTLDSLNTTDDGSAGIFSHAVIDATSSQYWEGRSIYHAPGYACRWFRNPQDPFGPYIQGMLPIPNDVAYGMKIRGT